MTSNETFIKKTVSAVFVILLSAILLFLGYLTAFKNRGDYSYFENRELAKFPKLSVKTVLSGEYFSDIDSYVSDHAAGRSSAIKLSTYIDLYVLKRPVVNGIIIAEDALLPDVPKKFDRESADAAAEVIAERLENYTKLCESYGGKFVYVAVPTQDMIYRELIPLGIPTRVDALVSEAELLFEKLSARGVPYIDMNGLLSEEDYSKVDHHYNLSGAYKTYAEIMRYFGREELILTDKDYGTMTFEPPYLGSRARKLYGLWETDERVSVIVPNEDIPIKRTFYGDTVDLGYYTAPTGNYATYNVYMNGDYDITEIMTERAELPTLLLYGDSFSNAVESIIWTAYDSMTSIDFRGYRGMTLSEYITEYKPDHVVAIIDYSALLTTTGNGG